MRPRARRYKGFILTPHAVQVEDGQSRARLWTVGVLLRTETQHEDRNRYFQLRGVLVSSKSDALRQGMSYGRRLIDEELIAYIRRLVRKDRPAAAARIYRRARDSLMWHFSERCSFWPEGNYEMRRTRPPTKHLCNECLALASTNR